MMLQPNKSKTVKVLAVLVLVTLFWLLLLSLHLPLFKPRIVAAQEPILLLGEETLAAFEPWLPSIQPADTARFDLTISKRANVSSVTSGGRITFTVMITNSGPDPAGYIFFYDDYPAQMRDVGYLFNTTAISDGQAKPTWLLPNPIPAGNRVTITVTGVLTSGPDITVANTAVVTPFISGEITPTNNSAQAQVGIIGHSPVKSIFLPVLFKAPPPPPLSLVYHEDFSSSSAWYEFSQNGCVTDNRDGRYWVDLSSSNRECLPPAKNDSKPERPYRTYGEFEVSAYHSEDIGSNAAYGIFINGQGGDNFYLFMIWPNNGCNSGGDWQLIRNRSGSRTTLRSGACDPAINRGGATNVLRIGHKNDLTLTVYANGVLLSTFVESSASHLTGEANGVYVRSADRTVRMKFDDFKVYRYN